VQFSKTACTLHRPPIMALLGTNQTIVQRSLIRAATYQRAGVGYDDAVGHNGIRRCAPRSTAASNVKRVPTRPRRARLQREPDQRRIIRQPRARHRRCSVVSCPRLE